MPLCRLTLPLWMKLTLVVLTMLCGLVWRGAYSEASDQSKDPVIAHLEFLGYECDVLNEGIRARHSSRLSLLVTHSWGGIKIQTGFRGVTGKLDDIARFQTLNAVNASVRVAHFYWTTEGHLFAEAWIPGLYDKGRFAALLEAWEYDMQLLRESYPKLKAYLTE